MPLLRIPRSAQSVREERPTVGDRNVEKRIHARHDLREHIDRAPHTSPCRPATVASPAAAVPDTDFVSAAAAALAVEALAVAAPL